MNLKGIIRSFFIGDKHNIFLVIRNDRNRNYRRNQIKQKTTNEFAGYNARKNYTRRTAITEHKTSNR